MFQIPAFAAFEQDGSSATVVKGGNVVVANEFAAVLRALLRPRRSCVSKGDGVAFDENPGDGSGCWLKTVVAFFLTLFLLLNIPVFHEQTRAVCFVSELPIAKPLDGEADTLDLCTPVTEEAVASGFNVVADIPNWNGR